MHSLPLYSPNDVGMFVLVKLLQQCDLSQRGSTHSVVGEGYAHLLDGHVAAGVIVEGPINGAIGACKGCIYSCLSIINGSLTHTHMHAHSHRDKCLNLTLD